MNIWDGLGTALIAAVVAFATARFSNWLDRRSAERVADASWTPKVLPAAPGLPWRAVVITNTGRKEARDVHLELGGGGAFDMDPNCSLDRIRPGEAIRFVLTESGNSVARIQWTTHRGKASEPLELFLDPS